jgi:hypothetical protein
MMLTLIKVKQAGHVLRITDKQAGDTREAFYFSAGGRFFYFVPKTLRISIYIYISKIHGSIRSQIISTIINSKVKYTLRYNTLGIRTII